jgi:hypothetical protein
VDVLNLEAMPEVVLDPFTVVCKLALLSFKPKGTKLAIRNNCVDFTHPVAKEQALRWFMSHIFDSNAYSRAALCNLRKPICRALRWYAAMAPMVFINAVIGLEILYDLYNKNGNDNAVESLRACLTILNNFDNLPKLAEDEDDESRGPMLTKLKAMWSDSEIECVEAWMVLLSEGDSETPHSAVAKSIEAYLTEKEPQLNEIMTKTAV